MSVPWDAVTAIAEIVSAIGVVASLIYVGVQIRQNTIATQWANARRPVSDTARAMQAILDKEVSGIALRGLDDLEALDPSERYRFDLALATWLEAIEQAFADHNHRGHPDDRIISYQRARGIEHKRWAKVVGAEKGGAQRCVLSRG